MRFRILNKLLEGLKKIFREDDVKLLKIDVKVGGSNEFFLVI